MAVFLFGVAILLHLQQMQSRVHHKRSSFSAQISTTSKTTANGYRRSLPAKQPIMGTKKDFVVLPMSRPSEEVKLLGTNPDYQQNNRSWVQKKSISRTTANGYETRLCGFAHLAYIRRGRSKRCQPIGRCSVSLCVPLAASLPVPACV